MFLQFLYALDPSYSTFASKGEAQIARGTRFVLCKTNKLVIAISLTLSMKSMGRISKIRTFFSYALH